MAPSTNSFKHLIEVDSAILRYSSRASAGVPYANWRIADVHFCNGDSPSRSRASFLCVNSGDHSPSACTICSERGLLIRNLLRNTFFL